MAKHADEGDGLPKRTDKDQRKASQAELERAERSRSIAREAEGSVGGRPGRENGSWNYER